ncbi:MAG: hypothetical protein ACKOWF_19105, partial [Chloroflexota bacterium]
MPESPASAVEAARTIRVALSHIAGTALDAPLRQPLDDPSTLDLDYLARFDYFTRFYDVFHAAGGRRILALGPPSASPFRVFTWPEREPCEVTLLTPPGETLFAYQLASIAPPRPGCPALLLEAGGREEVVAVQPSLGSFFAGRRVLVAKNRDMDLIWIRDWAEYHAREHDFDAVVLYDTRSGRYHPAEIESVLAGVPGIARAVVVDVAAPFGPVGSATADRVVSASFLQEAIPCHAVRRMAPLADLVMQLDIDELLLVQDPDAFDRLLDDPGIPVVTVRGENIAESAPRTRSGIRHRDSAGVFPSRPLRPGKWLARPRILPAAALPSLHLVAACPTGTCPPEVALICNLIGISTGWNAPARALGMFTAPGVVDLPALRQALDRQPWAEPDDIGAWNPLEQEDAALLVRWGAWRLAAGDAAAALEAAGRARSLAPDLFAARELLDLASGLRLPAPLPPVPGLDPAETVLLDAAIDGASRVVLFGAGRISPRLAASRRDHVTVVDPKLTVRRAASGNPDVAEAIAEQRLDLVPARIGNTDRHGRPVDAASRDAWPSCWRLPGPPARRAAIDLVIADGPFRAACALGALLLGVDGLVVFVAGGAAGPVRAALRPYAECIGEAGTCALFIRAAGFD